MDLEEIQSLILALGFVPKSVDSKSFVKNYACHSGYQISLDLQNKKISYGDRIKVHDETTSHFSQPENFVVLECVNRLLEKGYEPQHLELERK